MVKAGRRPERHPELITLDCSFEESSSLDFKIIGRRDAQSSSQVCVYCDFIRVNPISPKYSSSSSGQDRHKIVITHPLLLRPNQMLWFIYSSPTPSRTHNHHLPLMVGHQPLISSSVVGFNWLFHWALVEEARTRLFVLVQWNGFYYSLGMNQLIGTLNGSPWTCMHMGLVKI